MAEILALRHQLVELHKNGPPRLQRSDRLLWDLLSRCWSGGALPPDLAARHHRSVGTGELLLGIGTSKSRQRPEGRK